MQNHDYTCFSLICLLSTSAVLLLHVELSVLGQYIQLLSFIYVQLAASYFGVSYLNWTGTYTNLSYVGILYGFIGMFYPVNAHF